MNEGFMNYFDHWESDREEVSANERWTNKPTRKEAEKNYS